MRKGAPPKHLEVLRFSRVSTPFFFFFFFSQVERLPLNQERLISANLFASYKEALPHLLLLFLLLAIIGKETLLQSCCCDDRLPYPSQAIVLTVHVQ
ncbi:hypothetical protein NDU88_006988 [Pleurodeles waltl]|uniref:Uncharacterized protein n=1 Tax=Pleurodeles waltl TaxID=8319 RepID=A0AAV7SR71_PLEWA|nr:hypothetical protein NDU88_006988 [Pleurodeles waltl]